MSEPLVVVMAKAPELGKVKTRLAITLGHDETLKIYEFLLHLTLQNVDESGFSNRIYWTTRPNDHSGEIFLQVEGDLGEKMKAVFEDSFAHHSAVIMIGTDCPEVTPEVLSAAVNALQEVDCVFGPANDGGYYLIGMSAFHAEVLEGIAWSTEKVLQQSLEICEKNGLKYRLLETLTDIDEEKDWIEYINKENSLWKKF
jgi:rSAM/selenodomain-associated transferase 1